MAQIQGGPAIPVSVVTGGKIKGGKAIPVYGYTSAPTDGRRAAAGPARPVYVVSDAQMAAGTFQLEGGPAMPMYVAPSGLSVVGDAAQPVYVVGGSLGGAFTPASVAGLVAWYDFSDATTLFTDSARTTAVTADGNSIAGLTDKSGLGSHGSQTTSSFRPTYKTNIKNGKSVARADGSNDGLALVGTQYTGQTFTVFMAADVKTADSYRLLIDSTGGGALAFCIFGSANVGHYSAGNWRTCAAATTGWQILRFEMSSSNVTAYRNGSSIGASGVANQAFSGSLGLLSRASTGGGASSVDAGEVLVYRAAVSAADSALIESYLNTKWAVY